MTTTLYVRQNENQETLCTLFLSLLGLSYLVDTSLIGLPPHILASPVELHLQVGPHALSEKNNLGNKGQRMLSVCQSGTLQKGTSVG